MGDAFRRGGDGGQADADAERKRLLPPGEAVTAHAGNQRFGDFNALVEGAILQEQTEFVAAQPCQGVPLPDSAGEYVAHLAQHFITRGVARRVVDDLELIEIQVTEYVRNSMLAASTQGMLQAALELAPVDKPRQGIVIGMMQNRAVHQPLLGDVSENEHAARGFVLVLVSP